MRMFGWVHEDLERERVQSVIWLADCFPPANPSGGMVPAVALVKREHRAPEDQQVAIAFRERALLRTLGLELRPPPAEVVDPAGIPVLLWKQTWPGPPFDRPRTDAGPR
jgi:hypothetical protein